MIDYKQSLIGFHNPTLHKGLTPQKFLRAYIGDVLEARRFKKDGSNRIALKKWIEDNWKTQVMFVSRLFPNTLKLKQK